MRVLHPRLGMVAVAALLLPVTACVGQDRGFEDAPPPPGAYQHGPYDNGDQGDSGDQQYQGDQTDQGYSDDQGDQGYQDDSGDYQNDRNYPGDDRGQYVPPPPRGYAPPYDTDSGGRYIPPPPSGESPYYADQHYRADPRYQERRVDPNEPVYRGRDGRYYCKRSDGTTGLIVGGIAGGILGSILAPGHSRTLGTLLGAGGGAAIGSSVDRNNVRCR